MRLSVSNELTFVGDINNVEANANRIVVRVPVGVQTKRAILDLIAEGAAFPDWSGRNWQALNDCLSDLVWLEPKGLVIVHEDCPLTDPNDRRNYLEILVNNVRTWQLEGLPERLRVVFPLAVRDEVERSLKV